MPRGWPAGSRRSFGRAGSGSFRSPTGFWHSHATQRLITKENYSWVFLDGLENLGSDVGDDLADAGGGAVETVLERVDYVKNRIVTNVEDLGTWTATTGHDVADTAVASADDVATYMDNSNDYELHWSADPNQPRGTSNEED